MALRPIKDIRFFEGEEPAGRGHASHDHLGTLYPAVDKFQIAPTGTRYALALAEAGFHTCGYDHIYVVMTPALAEGEAEIPALDLERWMVHVNVGLSLDNWPTGDVRQQHETLIRAATCALKCLCERDALDASRIAQVEQRILEQGEDLELVRLRKDTKGYRITVSYRVRPYGSPSPVYLEYLDRKSQASGKVELLQVRDFEDVFALFGSVAITEGTIVLSPRSSATAKYTTRKYRTPIRVPVDRVLQGTPGC